MNYLPISGLPMIEEDEATDEVAQIYAEAKREMQVPFVPNFVKAVAISPAALAILWNAYRAFLQHSTLPQSLTAMIQFTIARANQCEYCSVNHELTCRTLGIDEETLTALVEDLGNVSPKRIRAIIEFSLKVAHDPRGLVAEDYERLREQGITDEELVEIILIAAQGSFNDILADALKIKVDAPVAEALGR
ncbi:MAG: peroxidase-related enzyme [Anaerolineae bacterium]|nr:peroxidase-related enzyme [Anaerolineae bacterium]